MNEQILHSRRQNLGVSLIEVLIALVVISIGLLGLAGLQVTGLAYTHSAELRGTAAIVVNNMAAAMSANLAGVENDLYQIEDTSEVLSSQPLFCRVADCTAAQVATADLWLWATQVDRELPGGKGKIVCEENPCRPNSAYTITVSWQEKNFAREADGQASGDLVTTTFSTVFVP